MKNPLILLTHEYVSVFSSFLYICRIPVSASSCKQSTDRPKYSGTGRCHDDSGK